MSATKNPPAASTDLEAVALSMEPRLRHRVTAWWAGRRDGRKGLVPDAETGLTPYLHLVCAVNSTMVESERLRTTQQCAPLDKERALLLERRERAQEYLDQDEAPPDGYSMEAVRARRTMTAAQARWLLETARATERISEVDELRAERVTVGELRIRRCTQRTDQLVAIYWRMFQRTHAHAEELRAVYRVPAVPIPPHPLNP
ncbi:hypothetical protein [Nocardia sp. NPDC058705]|uniref:hypothetical protein n=1 Tax=Nocardia sp. NPDC058705 TaxID=3346609 RepID=UPI0036A87AA4